jgi:glycosyltransferase involved in cell wall biosynthesis
MRLLVVSHSCATAANQRLYGELENLTGWKLTLAIPAPWKDEFGNVLDEAPWKGFNGRVRKIPVFGSGNIILHVYRTAWAGWLKRERFDAIYMNHEPYALATAQVCLAAKGLPTAFGFYSCQNIEKKYPFPISKLERLVYENSRFAFPITTAVADVLSAKGYRGASTICPLPVDPGLYCARGEAADKQLIPRGPGEAVIGYVGRLVEPKGLRTLAAALGQIRDLKWKLVLIGKGDFEAEFRSLLTSQGVADRAEFLGYIPHDETPRYLSAFDMLVLPSETQPNWKEQFGRVITESFSCGTPVIGSDSGEIPNLIRSGEGGLVFPEKNATEFAASLRRLIENPRLRSDLGAKGMQFAASQISLKAVAIKMAGAIERAVEYKSHAT